MIFNFTTEGVAVKWEPADTDSEKRIIEQGFLQLWNMIIRFSEIETRINLLHPRKE